MGPSKIKLWFAYFSFALAVPSSLAPTFASNFSIFDLCWTHVSTCSYPPPSTCWAATLYSYWSVNLLASVPERNIRLNAQSSSCWMDSDKRQRRLRWMKLKWNWYLKWMWCWGCLQAFQHCSSRMRFICTPVRKLCKCGVTQSHLLKPWLCL